MMRELMSYLRDAKSVIKIAMPLFWSNIALFVSITINVVFSTSMSNAAVSGVASSSYIIILFSGLAGGIRIALQREVAKNKNTGQYLDIKKVANFMLSYILTGTLLGLALFYAIPFLAYGVASDPEVVTYLIEYSKLIAISTIVYTSIGSFNSYYNGLGKTWFSSRSTLAVNILDFCLTFVFFKWQLSPLYGKVSALSAGTLAAYVFVAAYILFAHRKQIRRHATYLCAPKHYLADVLRISVKNMSIGLESVLYFVGWGLTYKLVSRLGTSETAVLAVIANLFLLPVYFSQSVGSALLTSIAGISDFRVAKRKTYGAIIVTLIFAILSACTLYLLGNQLAQLYFTHPSNSSKLFLDSLLLICIFIVSFVAAEVLKGALYSVNKHNMVNLYVFLCQWVLFLGGGYILISFTSAGFASILSLLISYRLLLILFYSLSFSGSFQMKGMYATN